MVSLSIVVGNPKPNSRTLKVAKTLASKLFGELADSAAVIDLAEYTEELFLWPNPKMDAINSSVAQSDFVIFASPTYKATYSGLLKVFLDRYPANGLTGVTAIPLHTGGDLTHSMGPTVNLAPLLVELGAVVPGRGFYFVISQLDRLDEIAQAAADQYAASMRKIAAIAAALPGEAK